jgi:glycosyltransferase involved in cell wall biosynthesis
MKILLVNDYATPTGGAEIRMLALRDGLRRRGHDARLFASSARTGGGSSSADYECFGTTSRYRTLLQTANPWAAWELRRVLAHFQPDVVHVRIFLTQLSPLILPVLRDVPSLFHVVWYRALCPLGTKRLPDGSLCQRSAGAACYQEGCLPLRDWLPLMLQLKLWRRWRTAFNLLLANSAAVRRRLVAEGIEPVEVLWNGVPPQPLRPPLSAPPTVAFAARLVPEKGAEVLLQAFARVAAQVPEARLLVAGEGPERERLRGRVGDLGLTGRVSLLGHVCRPEMERCFAAAWVQAVPAQWEEPFGNTAAEALMRGTAVVASATGGLAELVQDGETGLLVPPGNPAALAGALLRLLRDRDGAERMGRAGRRFALTHLNEATYLDRLLQLYQALHAARRTATGSTRADVPALEAAPVEEAVPNTLH